MNTSDMFSALALMIAVVSGVSPNGRPIVRQVHEEHSLQVLPSGVLAKSPLPHVVTPSSSAKDELFTETAIADSSKKSGKDELVAETVVADSARRGASASHSSIVSQGMQALVRDDRSALVIFRDEKCETELSGFWLPAELEINDGECIRTVADMENLTAKMQKGTSVTWSCGVSSDDPSAQVARIVSHFGTNCTQGDDDTRKFTVASEDFASVRDGECTKANNREADVIYYIMVMNAKTVSAWPTCMQKSLIPLYIAIAIAVVCTLICLHQVLTRFVLPSTMSGAGKQMPPPDINPEDDNDIQQGSTAPAAAPAAAATGAATPAAAAAAAAAPGAATGAVKAEEVDF